jgi:hypothetical protein
MTIKEFFEHKHTKIFLSIIKLLLALVIVFFVIVAPYPWNVHIFWAFFLPITGIEFWKQHKKDIKIPVCKHNEFVKITHWWFNVKCKECNKRFRKLPKGDYYTL